MSGEPGQTIGSLEAFYGSVATIDDALLLVEAVRLGTLPRLRRRLTDEQQQLIRSGSVFVWNEGETKIKRWTDGRHWSNSRMKGRFFLYKELAASKKTGTARARVAIAAAAAAKDSVSCAASDTTNETASVLASWSSASSAFPVTSGSDPTEGAGEAEPFTPLSQSSSNVSTGTPKPFEADTAGTGRVFLRKRTISFQTRHGEKYHLVAYYHGQGDVSMSRPSHIPHLASLVIEPGFYFTGLDMTPLMLSLKEPVVRPDQSPSRSTNSVQSPPLAPTNQPAASPPSLPTFSQSNLPSAAETSSSSLWQPAPSHSPVLAASRDLQGPKVNDSPPFSVTTSAATVPTSTYPPPLSSPRAHIWYRSGAWPSTASNDGSSGRDSWPVAVKRGHRDYPQYDRGSYAQSLPISHRDQADQHHHQHRASDPPPTASWSTQKFAPSVQYYPMSSTYPQVSASPPLSALHHSVPRPNPFPTLHYHHMSPPSLGYPSASNSVAHHGSAHAYPVAPVQGGRNHFQWPPSSPNSNSYQASARQQLGAEDSSAEPECESDGVSIAGQGKHD